jgi:hypothetical protein
MKNLEAKILVLGHNLSGDSTDFRCDLGKKG